MTQTPLWQAISDQLSAEIAAGQWRPGDRLPTEAELARRFGVNRHTVRRALAHMADGDLVHSRRGAGVFVALRPTEYPLGDRVRFHQILTAQGRIPGRRILTLARRSADSREAAALELGEGDPVLSCEGLSLADDHPLALFRSVFPAERLPGLEEALTAENSITRALQRVGVTDYVRRLTRMTAVAATAAQALHLRLSEGAPILRSVAINTDLSGRPVEYGTTWFAGDRVTLTLHGPEISGPLAPERHRDDARDV